ncbi:hypothetical protein ABK040_006914 [Willaertia magna]
MADNIYSAEGFEQVFKQLFNKLNYYLQTLNIFQNQQKLQQEKIANLKQQLISQQQEFEEIKSLFTSEQVIQFERLIAGTSNKIEKFEKDLEEMKSTTNTGKFTLIINFVVAFLVLLVAIYLFVRFLF